MSDPHPEFFRIVDVSGVEKTTLLTHPRRLSPKQAAIMNIVKLNGSITLSEAAALVGGNVYHNKTKHTGALLANMVNQGLLVRERAGVFTLLKKP